MNNYSIFDAHCDTLCHIVDKGGNVIENSWSVDKKRMLTYKKYTQIFACYIDPKYHNAPKARFEKLYEAYKAQDFSGINPIMSLEGGEVIESIEDVDYLNECGIKCIALTWNNTNKIAGGVADPDSGLTEFGKSVIRRMEELGILVDVSHLNDKSFYDVASVATRPIIATHSNSRTICSHRRNLTDDMFKIIRESGGCAGLNLHTSFLADDDNGTIDDAIKHIEHFMSLDGVDAIGMGSDFDGIPRNPEGINGVGELYRLFDKLEEIGTPKDAIEKISHANFERVFGVE